MQRGRRDEPHRFALVIHLNFYADAHSFSEVFS